MKTFILFEAAMNSVIIRECNLQDKKDYWKLNLQFMDEVREKNPYWQSICNPTQEEMDFVFKYILNNPQSIKVFLAIFDEMVVGYANIFMNFSVWSKGIALSIDDLYVNPQFRGKKIGSKIMSEIEDYARKNKYKRLQLHAEMDNESAHGLYRRLGFHDEEMLYFKKDL